MERADKWLRPVYDAIVSFDEAHNHAPSYREIAGIVGVASTATVQVRLESLAEAGLIAYRPQKARTIRVLRSWPTEEREAASCRS